MIKILFDTETTGLVKPSAIPLHKQPYITEISCLKIDDDVADDEEIKILGTFDSLVRPPIPISEEITKITGINDQILQDAPEFCEIYKELAEFFHGANELIAHNLSFDRSMVEIELKRISKQTQFPWPIKHTCTVERSKHIEGHRLSLAKLHTKVTGSGHTGAHRADADVAALFRCYHWLCEQGHIK